MTGMAFSVMVWQEELLDDNRDGAKSEMLRKGLRKGAKTGSLGLLERVFSGILKVLY